MRLITLPNRRESLQLLGIALLAAVICWYFGVDVLHAILLGCGVTVIAFTCLVVILTPQERELGWRGRKHAGGKGARSDVANLSGALRGGWGRVGRTADRRLWQIARRRLALEGLELQNPAHQAAIEERIGRPAYRALLRSTQGGMRLRTLNRCLDALDTVNPTYYPMKETK